MVGSCDCVEKPCSQAGQKNHRCKARDKPTSGGVLRRYVVASPLRAGKVLKRVERCYLKRLPRAGCWQMGLFQRPV